MSKILTDFLQEFTCNYPLLARKYHTFNWGKLADATKVRVSQSSPDKHIKDGLVPEGISYQDYRQIWLLCSKVRKTIKHKADNKNYYKKAKDRDCYNYQSRLEKGLVNKEDENTRKKKSYHDKKTRVILIDKLRTQAKLFGLDEGAVDKMDDTQLAFWGNPIKSIVEETGEVQYINPALFHYNIGSTPNTTIKMEDYL